MISDERAALGEELRRIEEKIKKLKNTDPLQQIQKQIWRIKKPKLALNWKICWNSRGIWITERGNSKNPWEICRLKKEWIKGKMEKYGRKADPF